MVYLICVWVCVCVIFNVFQVFFFFHSFCNSLSYFKRGLISFPSFCHSEIIFSAQDLKLVPSFSKFFLIYYSSSNSLRKLVSLMILFSSACLRWKFWSSLALCAASYLSLSSIFCISWFFWCQYSLKSVSSSFYLAVWALFFLSVCAMLSSIFYLSCSCFCFLISSVYSALISASLICLFKIWSSFYFISASLLV